MSRRFFDQQPFVSGSSATLGAEASHHIAKVLRMRAGDTLTVFNGQGGEWEAVIESISKKDVTILIGEHMADDRVPSAALHVALPAIKGERMDIAIQKATELGATSFQLLETERVDVRLSGERLTKKLGHWQRVAISACEQCGMNRVPGIYPPKPLAAYLAEPPRGATVFGKPGAPALAQLREQTSSEVTVITGPEGGFTDEEYALLENSGASGVTLGERVLRAETAPLALLAAIQALRN